MPQGEPPLPSPLLDSPLLEVRALTKSFHTSAGSVQVLNELDLTLARGEFLAIVGESGSGKSSLLHLLGALEPSDSGSILLAGIELTKMSGNQLAAMRNRDLGFIYQAHHLIPELDALENAMLPLLVRGESKQSAAQHSEEILTRLGLSHRLRHRSGQLSGGEAQRVAVARAVIGKPHLLLADEPTGNLDERTADEVFAAMRQLCIDEHTAVIMVTHSMALARRADRRLRLQGGKLLPDC